jgi:hypothetical protein
MRNPISPSHPQLNIDAPHAFLNPYAFLVALVANALGLTPIIALSVFGIFNFCVFCIGVYVFSSNFYKQCPQKIAFYALLLILFLWGQLPWPYSGFFSYQIFLFNLPYPSTLIGGLCLLTLGVTGRYPNGVPVICWAVLVVVLAVCLLTHPLTAQFLIIGLVAQALLAGGSVVIRLVKIISLCVVAIGLAALWPYYPFIDLFLGAGSVYHIANLDMYFHLPSRIWPFVALSPVIAWILFQRRYWTLTIMFVGTILIYAFGYYSHTYSYGRIISYAIIIAQVSCAIALVKLENWLSEARPREMLLMQALLVLFFLVWSADWLYTSTSRLLTAANSMRLGRPVFNQVSYTGYSFLFERLPAGSTVLANLDTSWRIPTFGAKTIAIDRATAFVPDVLIRKADVLRFFASDTLRADRIDILGRYRPKFVLLSKESDKAWETIQSELVPSLGRNVAVPNEQLILIELYQ